uniref:Uncharacterized protein n=1 Tax=Caenorhabditis japonica TaxID=281687 RepID=A0A8R1IKC6_CAEJA
MEKTIAQNRTHNQGLAMYNEILLRVGYDLRSAQHNGEVHIGGNENIIEFIRRYMSAIVGIGFGRDANGQEMDIFYVIQDLVFSPPGL